MLLSPLRSPLQPALRGPLQAGIGGGLRILDFASLTATQLQSRFGWTRSGAGTLTDSGSAVRYGAHNLFWATSDFTNASWAKTAGLVFTATTVQDPNSSGFKTANRFVSGIPQNSTVTYSVRVKKESARTGFGGVNILFSGGVTLLAYVGIDEVLGSAFQLAGSTVVPVITVTENTASEFVVNITCTDNAANTLCQVFLYGTLSLNGSTLGNGPGSVRTYTESTLKFGSAAGTVPNAGTSAAIYLMRTPDHTHGVPGLLLEGARTNLFANSTNASTLVSTGLTSNSLNVVGPMGVTSLATLVENTSNTVHGATRSSSIGVGTYAVSAHMKAGTRRFVHVLLDDGANAGGVRVDTQNWTVTTETNGGGVSSSNPFVIPLANGIYRVGATVTSTGSLNNFGVYGSSDNTSAGRFYLGVGSTIIAGDIQLEAGAYPTSYIPNATTGTMLRVADVAEIGPGPEFDALFGLPTFGAESAPALSSLVLIGAVSGTWAAGGGGFTFTSTASQSRPGVQFASTIAAKQYRISVNVLSITGGTQLRIDGVGAADVLVPVGVTTFTVTVAAASTPRFRLENTSAISGHGFVIGSVSVQEVIREGAIVVECVPMSNTGSTGISVDDGNGGYDEYMSVYWNSGQVSFVVYSGNVSRFSTFTAGAVTAGVPLKIAFAWSNGRFGISVNGATPIEGGSGPPPIMTRARVFGDIATGAQSDGLLRKLTNYPTARFGAALQALTV